MTYIYMYTIGNYDYAFLIDNYPTYMYVKIYKKTVWIRKLTL